MSDSKLVWRFESRLNKALKVVGKAEGVGKNLGNSGPAIVNRNLAFPFQAWFGNCITNL
jgi:hypothetical protein